MKLHRFTLAAAALTAALALPSAHAQDTVDLATLAQIKHEAFDNSKVMENLFYLSEVYGPRVNNSRNHRAAAEWAMKQMREWGMTNVRMEPFKFGTGWQIKKYYVAMEAPAYAAIPAFRWRGRRARMAPSARSRFLRPSIRRKTLRSITAS